MSMGKQAVLFGSPPWGGPTYARGGGEVFDLAKMEPYSLCKMHGHFTKYCKDAVFFLPRTSNLNQIAEEAAGEQQVQVVHYCMHGFSKALCAYYGGFSEIPET